MKNIKFVTHILRIRKENDAYYTITPYAKVIKLNETSYQLLKLCEEVDDSNELIKNVVEKYDLSKAQGVREVERFMSGMIKCGLITLD